MPYTQLQQLQDASLPWGTPWYDSSVFLADLTDDVITTITAHVPGKPSPMSESVIYTVDGAYNEIGPDDTAFGGDRAARFVIYAIGAVPDRDGVPTARGWVHGLIDALRPASSTGGYVNAIGADEMAGVEAVYGRATVARLAAVKAAYDPQDVFHRNAGVAPGKASS